MGDGKRSECVTFAFIANGVEYCGKSQKILPSYNCGIISIDVDVDTNVDIVVVYDIKKWRH